MLNGSAGWRRQHIGETVIDIAMHGLVIADDNNYFAQSRIR